MFGHAVYTQPEFVSEQPLPEFFAGASRPDNRAYKDFRRYLLETSQLPGGFYSSIQSGEAKYQNAFPVAKPRMKTGIAIFRKRFMIGSSH